MLTQTEFDPSPFTQFLNWYEGAIQAKIKNADAMTLATADRDGIPSARMVLFKGLNLEGFRFFTNYESRKAKQLNENRFAALVFYWALLDRQVRIEGKVKTLPPEESDQYWLSRSRESRISAMASPQSTPIPNREVLEKQVNHLSLAYEGQEIPRPKNWGGYCLIPNLFEFWYARDHRLHDRLCYLKQNSQWEMIRLSP